MQQLGDGALLLPAARLAMRNADSEYPFRQHSDFHYLTAFDEPDALCVLRVDEPRYVLFVRPRDPKAETWTGRRAGVDGAVRDLGADVAYAVDEVAARLPELLRNVETLHYTWGRDAPTDDLVRGVLEQHRQARPRRGHGIGQVRDPEPAIHEMRLFKDAYELDRMRAAAQTSVAAHLRVLREAQPGMHEYELEALLEYEFRVRGARAPAYGSIVGSGDNATILHYRENRSPLVDGQLVLVDAGAEVDLYAADITRTFPAGRRFEPAQHALYEVVLAAQKKALECVRPGRRFHEPHDAAVQTLCTGLVDLGLCEGPAERLRESGDFRRFYMHRTSHWLGLDVHDAGLYTVEGQGRTFEPGMVLTVEPGLYVASQLDDVPDEFRGTGIRIEDDVLVTAEGHEVLTAGVPKEIDAIEALRASAPGLAAPVRPHDGKAVASREKA